MKISEEVLKCEKQILELLNAEEDDEDIIFKQYDWETVEAASLQILLAEHDREEYSFTSRIVLYGIWDGNSIKDDVLIALLNLRLNTEQNPYDDNTVWTITSGEYGLSYDNSEYNPFHDLRLEMKLNKYGLTFRTQEELEKDACDGCPVIADYSKPSKCPECGKYTMSTTYDGACMLYHCQNCGYDIVGASFYPKCDHDKTTYTIRFLQEDYSKDQILLLARLLGYSSVKMADYCSSSIDIETVRYFKDALLIMEQCWTADIACYINPMPPYCQFGKCSNTARKE